MVQVLSWFGILSLLGCQSEEVARRENEAIILIAQLGDDRADVRDGAFRSLKGMGPKILTILRRKRGAASTPELQLRLRELDRELSSEVFSKEYQAGRLEKALLALAEYEHLEDPAGYVQRRVAKAAADMIALSDELRKRAEGVSVDDPQSIAKEIVRRRDGPWIMPLLLEELGKKSIHQRVPALKVFELLIDEALPYLCAAVTSENPQKQANAIGLLLRGQRTHSGLLDAVRKVLRDVRTDPAVRELALELERAIAPN